MSIYERSFEIAKPRRSWLKRVGCVLLALSLTLLLLALGAWAWWHVLLTQRLDEALAELDRNDSGWRLGDIEAAREQIPEEENSARVVVAVSKLLPRNWPPPAFLERFSHLSPEELLAPDDFARLNQELKSVRPALDEARTLAKISLGRHRIFYKRDVMSTLLDDQQQSRKVVYLLLCHALQCDQNQDIKSAWISCQAAFNAARSLGDEPLSISQLIRGAGVASACGGIERALAQGEATAEDLEGIRKLLVDEESFQDLLIAARGERASYHELFDAMEGGDISISEMTDGDQDDWKKRLFGFVYRDNIRAQHPLMLDLASRSIAITQLPTHEQSQAGQQLDRELSRELRGRRAEWAVLPLLCLSIPGEVSRRKHALVRCALAALAAERYRQTHKKWPDSLESLCPQFLAAVPLDPFDGESLRYRRVEEGVIIYSVSSDGIDNNGNLDREHPNQPGVDIGVRLWDVAKRRQPPRPKAQQEDNPR